MNNCGCNEHQFESEMVATIMKGSVKAVADMGWDGPVHSHQYLVHTFYYNL